MPEYGTPLASMSGSPFDKITSLNFVRRAIER